jgi:hypothetical protein
MFQSRYFTLHLSVFMGDAYGGIHFFRKKKKKSHQKNSKNYCCCSQKGKPKEKNHLNNSQRDGVKYKRKA